MKQKITSDYYEKIEILGRGAFGEVIKVKNKSNGEIYALKMINLGFYNNENKELCLNEIKILSKLKNQYIVSFVESFIDLNKEVFCIVMELSEGGDLLNFIKKLKKKTVFLPEKKVLNFVFQILKGIQYIHENKILHRDLKLANIFLNKSKNKIKIGDFGVAKILKHSLAFTKAGTPYYTPPEIINNLPYSYEADIWSLGCIIFELCNQRPPFVGTSEFKLKEEILKKELDYNNWNKKYSRDLFDLVSSILEKESFKRSTISEILKNKIFSNLRPKTDIPYIKKIIKFNFIKNNCNKDAKNKFIFKKHKINLTKDKILPKITKKYSPNKWSFKRKISKLSNKNSQNNLVSNKIKKISNSKNKMLDFILGKNLKRRRSNSPGKLPNFLLKNKFVLKKNKSFTPKKKIIIKTYTKNKIKRMKSGNQITKNFKNNSSKKRLKNVKSTKIKFRIK